VGVGEEDDVGAADADGVKAEAEACAEVVVVEAFVAFGDDEVELVHPAAATHIRSAAHIAIIAACFFIIFIKVIPQKMDVRCEYRNSCVKVHKVSVCDIVSRDF
jgi:hypothetical protein